MSSTICPDVEEVCGREAGCRGTPDEPPREPRYVFGGGGGDAPQEFDPVTERKRDEQAAQDAKLKWLREAVDAIAPVLLRDRNGVVLGSLLVRLASEAGLDRNEALHRVCGCVPKVAAGEANETAA